MSNENLEAFFEKMNAQGLMLTYDDVRMHTQHSDVIPAQTNLHSHFSLNIPLRLPIVSSAMDTVTESRMAIAMASLGGLGVIHKNMTPEAQAKEVRRVKLHLNGRIDTPIVVSPSDTLAEVRAMRAEKRFGFHSFPVVDGGTIVGLLTGSDFRFSEGNNITVAEAMTPMGVDFLYGTPRTSLEEAYSILLQNKKTVLPLIDEAGRVAGMYVLSDLQRIRSAESTHNVDDNGRLIAAAAVGAGKGTLEKSTAASTSWLRRVHT